jgi:hypothetical protein
VICGTNNKLDGYYVPLPGETPPRTRYDLVPCVMVLDPQALHGVGPPGNERVPELPGGTYHAYAFLDLPSSTVALYLPEGALDPVPPDPRHVATLRLHPDRPAGATEATRPWFMLNVENGDSGDTVRTRALLCVDRNLQLQRVVTVTGESVGRTEAYWRARWHVIPPPIEATPTPLAAP